MRRIRSKADLNMISDYYAQYACNGAAEMVKNKIEEFIRSYYHEYTPEQYERTWKFLNSVVQTDAEKVGNSWVAKVYIDPTIEYDSMWGEEHWTMENTAYQANQSLHGNRKVSDMQFFDDAFDEVKQDKHLTAFFKRFLEENGIDVQYEKI